MTTETIISALRAAREIVHTERTHLADAHMSPVTNTLDADGQAGVAEYDVVLRQIDDALAKAAPLLAEIDRLAREQSNTQARLDRAILAAEEHFGEDAVRYKLSLSKNGRPLNCFPSDMDGKWFAFQRADDDAHVGLSLRCLEAEAERDALREQVERLKADAERWAFAMDWEQRQFAVCKRVGNTGACWEPIKTSGPIDAARAQGGEG